MKRFWKISTRAIGGLIVVFLAYLGLLVYPGILFANSAQYNNLTIYLNSDLSGAERVLQDIDRALEESEIHDESLSHDIFLGDGNEPFALWIESCARICRG